MGELLSIIEQLLNTLDTMEESATMEQKQLMSKVVSSLIEALKDFL